MSDMAEAIRALAAEKGLSEDSIKMMVENSIKAAYKKAYGTCDNCIVQFSKDLSDVEVFSRKVVVDGVYDPAVEIELEEAKQYNPDAEEGDEMDVKVDPHDFGRAAVSIGKQAAHQNLSENFKDTLYNEFKNKVGELIVGNVQREYKGSIYVDLGRVEGLLPLKFQNPHEVYEKNERIRTVCVDLKRTASGVQLILSRTDPELVKKLLELEVPEINENIIGIQKVVREAGYRTKIAVYSNKEDVDPVGACVGLKGVRIQNVIHELEGEKIDVISYNEDPREFIKNALSPAEVERVVILDFDKKEALAIVGDTQYSLAIGKQGQNVRLANRLCDWNIDVKTISQAAEMDIVEADTKKAAEELFASNGNDYEEIQTVAQLPGVDQRVAAILKEAGIDDIEQFVTAYNEGTAQKVEGLSEEEIEAVNKIISENVEFEDEEVTEEESEEEYQCPECGAKITLDMQHCPKCGVELVFEQE